MNFELDERLEYKLNNELHAFYNKLLKEDKKEILESAYEIAMKEELKCHLEDMSIILSDNQKKLLLSKNDLLEELYNDWLDSDISLGENIRESLDDSIIRMTKEIDTKEK